MMSEPTVSVVLTNYNGSRFVAAAMDSVLAQTYTDWEMILVDDGSTDGSLEILRAYAARDGRIRLLVNERNSQVSFSHNEANRVARGRYIAALDNDDAWTPDKLEKQVAYMDAHPEVGVCFTLVRLMDENGAPLEDASVSDIFRAPNRSRARWIHDLLVEGNCLANDSSLIRREIMEAIGENDLCLVQLHDYDMWVKIPRIAEMYVMQEPLMIYRKVTEGSTSITTKTERNTRRSFFEFAWIVAHTVEELEEGLFREAFGASLRRPDLTGEAATRCEKAILMMGEDLVTNVRPWAFEMLRQLIAGEETRELLRKEFRITQHDVYRMTGEPIFYDRTARETAIRLEQTRDALEESRAETEEARGMAEERLETIRDLEEVAEDRLEYIRDLEDWLQDSRAIAEERLYLAGELESSIDEIKHSFSWRITAT